MSSADAEIAREAIGGIVPPMTLPYDGDGEVELSAIAPQIDFMIEAGVHGIVAGGSTGEGHTLSTQEFGAVMRTAHDAVAGRVPFVAGIIVNSTRQAIERAALLRDLKVAALQVTPVHYLFRPGPDATIEHFRSIAAETDLPVIIYNVVPWNYLDVDLMLRIMEEVPGVIGMKQSAGDLKAVSDLVRRIPPTNIVLTGTDALLYPAFSLGVHGAISALTAAVPALTVDLWNRVKNDDHSGARVLHTQLGELWNVLRHDNLPACVKYVQHRQGLELYGPRAPMEPVDAAQRTAIDRVLDRILPSDP